MFTITLANGEEKKHLDGAYMSKKVQSLEDQYGPKPLHRGNRNFLMMIKFNSVNLLRYIFYL